MTVILPWTKYTCQGVSVVISCVPVPAAVSFCAWIDYVAIITHERANTRILFILLFLS